MGSPKNRCYFVLKVGKYFYIFSPLLGMRYVIAFFILDIAVTSRKGRVSRNGRYPLSDAACPGHVPQGACE